MGSESRYVRRLVGIIRVLRLRPASAKTTEKRAMATFWPLPEVMSILFLGVGLAAIVALRVVEDHSIAYSLCDNKACFETFFLDLMKVPLRILAATAAILALCATNHRSEQSVYSMRLMREQNTFSNYHLHQQKFKEFVEQKFQLPFVINSVATLYKNFFPGAREGNFEVSAWQVASVVGNIEKICSTADRWLHTDRPTSKDALDVVVKLELLLNEVDSLKNINHIQISIGMLNWKSYLGRWSETMKQLGVDGSRIDSINERIVVAYGVLSIVRDLVEFDFLSYSGQVRKTQARMKAIFDDIDLVYKRPVIGGGI